jgi:hypothetical protein
MALKASRQRRRKFQRIPKARRVAVRRKEFDHLIDLLNERADLLNRILEDQQIQFQRIAQIQAQLDLMQQALARLTREVAEL